MLISALSYPILWMECKNPKLPKRHGRHDVLFALSQNCHDHSNDALYRIFIFRHNNNPISLHVDKLLKHVTDVIQSKLIISNFENFLSETGLILISSLVFSNMFFILPNLQSHISCTTLCIAVHCMCFSILNDTPWYICGIFYPQHTIS